MVIKST